MAGTYFPMPGGGYVLESESGLRTIRVKPSAKYPSGVVVIKPTPALFREEARISREATTLRHKRILCLSAYLSAKKLVRELEAAEVAVHVEQKLEEVVPVDTD